MAAQWPVLHARLVEFLPTLPGWPPEVYDGPSPVGDVPRAYCTVGYAQLEEAAGTFEQERAGNGFQQEESGSIRCELVTWTGDVDLASVRAQVFVLLDALEQAIRDDQTFGVLPPGSTTRLAVDVLPLQSTTGSVMRLPFSLIYFTRS